jgi:hypothetical protein
MLDKTVFAGTIVARAGFRWVLVAARLSRNQRFQCPSSTTRKTYRPLSIFREFPIGEFGPGGVAQKDVKNEGCSSEFIDNKGAKKCSSEFIENKGLIVFSL